MAKTSLTQEEIAQRRLDTATTAEALIDDLAYLREKLKDTNPSPGDIRRLSAIVRRLLIDGDLQDVAGPRIGRVGLTAPDSLALIRSAEAKPFQLLIVGLHSMFGSAYWAVAIEGALPVGAKPRTEIPGWEPNRLTTLSVDSFLAQRVIQFGGEWATRGDVIKYIANFAHGVHSTATAGAQKRAIKVIDRVRYIATYDTRKSNDRMLQINVSFLINHSTDRAPDTVDIALALLWNAAYYLIISHDVSRLEDEIRARG